MEKMHQILSRIEFYNNLVGDVCVIYNTRLLGRFVPIFYFNCENVLFVNIAKQKQTKEIRRFLKLSKNRIFKKKIFENSIIRKSFLGSREVPQKNYARSVGPF